MLNGMHTSFDVCECSMRNSFMNECEQAIQFEIYLHIEVKFIRNAPLTSYFVALHLTVDSNTEKYYYLVWLLSVMPYYYAYQIGEGFI